MDSATGSDAASPAGKDRIKPLATLAQACTNAATGDIIVCLAGHAETLTSGQTFSTANILVLLAELRAALTVWRPAAFVKGGFV